MKREVAIAACIFVLGLAFIYLIVVYISALAQQGNFAAGCYDQKMIPVQNPWTAGAGKVTCVAPKQ